MTYIDYLKESKMKKKKYNYEEYVHLIGQKIYAYKYENDPNGPLSWTTSKEKLLGKECVITEVHSSYPYIKVGFEDEKLGGKIIEWWLAHGHEEHIVREKTEDELYGDIYKLLTKI